MAAKLIVAVVVIAFDGRILDRPVHPFDLAIGPWMVRFSQSVFYFICLVDHVEAHRPRINCVPVPRLLCELDAIVRENGVDFVRNGFQQVLKKLPCGLAICFLNQLRHRKLAGAINGNKEMELAFLGSNLCDIDMELANRIALELLPLRLVACDVRQSGYAIPLQTSMRGRACQVRYRRLQGIEAIVQRQKCVPTERDHHRLLVFAQNG